jgi:trehalose 6-phosphate phosphatase
MDKGHGIKAFLEGTDVDTALYVGDDATDVDAFRGLRELADEGRLAHILRVGVRSEEAPPAVAGEADVVVEGTTGVRELLEVLVAD